MWLLRVKDYDTKYEVVKSRLPKSVRKYIRREKARLRRASLDPALAEARIQELVASILTKYYKYYKSKGRQKSDSDIRATHE